VQGVEAEDRVRAVLEFGRLEALGVVEDDLADLERALFRDAEHAGREEVHRRGEEERLGRALDGVACALEGRRDEFRHPEEVGAGAGEPPAVDAADPEVGEALGRAQGEDVEHEELVQETLRRRHRDLGPAEERHVDDRVALREEAALELVAVRDVAVVRAVEVGLAAHLVRLGVVARHRAEGGPAYLPAEEAPGEAVDAEAPRHRRRRADVLAQHDPGCALEDRPRGVVAAILEHAQETRGALAEVLPLPLDDEPDDTAHGRSPLSMAAIISKNSFRR